MNLNHSPLKTITLCFYSVFSTIDTLKKTMVTCRLSLAGCEERIQSDRGKVCCRLVATGIIFALILLIRMDFNTESVSMIQTEETLVVKRKLLHVETTHWKNNNPKIKKSEFVKMLQSQTSDFCPDLFNGNVALDLTEKQSREVELFNQQIEDVIYKHNSGRVIEGHSGNHHDMQRLYLEIAHLDFIKTVCETGFNAGHSTFMWLNANPDVVVYSFDIDMHNYTRPMAYYLQSRFPGRLHLTYGDSRDTIPEFHVDSPEVMCDLVIIDGGHHADIPEWDFENFYAMVPRNRENLVVLDDWPGREDVNITIGAMWRERIRKGRVQELFSCYKQNNKWDSGITLGQFV